MRILLAILALCLSSLVHATENRDALAPKSRIDEALALPLAVVTVATADLAASKLFYQEGLGMVLEGPLPLESGQRATLSRLWQLPEDLGWSVYSLHREGVKGAARIRLLVLESSTPHIHNSWSALEPGTFSMGFPNTDQARLDAHMRKLGFGSLNVMEVYPVPRTDGSEYMIYETIFNGPDFVHAVGIQRGDGMAQLGPVDSRGQGGPAYAAQVISDSDRVLAFYERVLGMELRSDRRWKSAGTKGALNVPDGTEFRFSIVYSKGATSGHLLFVDYLNRETLPARAPRLPHRGIALWTFPVTDLDRVMTNARSFDTRIVQAPREINMPLLGKVRVAVLEAPNGFMVEIFEQESP